MFAIALSELRMLLRNRLVAVCAILMPLGIGAVLMLQGVSRGGSVIAALQVLVMIGLGVYVTATTTLAARRQTLFLKRLRSGAVSDVSIIGGLVVPIVAVSLIQVALVLGVLGALAESPPQHVWLLVIAVLAAEVMFAGFALATAGITNSPEHAQVTTLPIFFLTLGVAFWITTTGTADLGIVKRALPGGALTELIGVAWNGGDLSSIGLLLAPTVAWTAIAVFAARAMFKWEPRA